MPLTIKTGRMKYKDGEGQYQPIDAVGHGDIVATVEDWMDENITGATGPVVIDSSLSVTGAAAEAETVGDELGTVRGTFISQLIGKKVSIIGDSIDTFNQSGYKIDGYNMYYPSQGVTTVEQTWWYKVIKACGASLEVNASWSGSRVTNTHSDPNYPDFYDRVEVIGNPDLIFVTLGTNDSSNSVSLGEYDFETTYTSLSESTFRTAYIKGVKGLQTEYPDALIVCISEKMGDAYRESVRYIAQELGVKFIDASDYVGSSGVHPGPFGMDQIARLVLFPTDKDLSQTNMAADAKATGEKIENVKSTIELYTGNSSIPMVSRKYIDLSGATVTMESGRPVYSGDSSSFSCGMVPCSGGQRFTINGTGGSGPRLYGFVDATGTVLHRSSVYHTANGYVLIAPSEAAWLIINTNDNSVSYVEEYATKRLDKIEELGRSMLSLAGGKVNGQKPYFFQGSGVKYTNGDTSSDSILSYTMYFPVKGFDTLRISMIKTVSSTSYGLAFYDDAYTFISGVQANYGADSITSEIRDIPIPENATFCRSSWIRDNQPEYETNTFSYELTKGSVYLSQEELDDATDKIQSELYKKVTITNWTKAIVNAINGNTSAGNGATAGPIAAAKVKFGSGCQGVIRMWKNGSYLGKCKNDGTIDKKSGNWLYFTGEVDTSDLMLKFGADSFDFSVMPTDGTTISSDGVADYGDAHFDAYINNFASLNDIEVVTSDIAKAQQVADYAQSSVSNITVINHRGFNTVAPENTLKAFELSAKHGFKYVETDVLFTAPDNNNPIGVPVLLHDATINRTARNADGTSISGNVYIADITYAEALTYDFGIWKGAEYAGTKIPTFEEFIKCCKRYGLHPYIELKNEKTYSQDEIDMILSIITAHGMKKHVSFISYDNNALLLVKNRWDWVELGLHTTGGSSGVSAFEALMTGKNVVFATHGMYVSIPNIINADIPACPYTVDTIAQLQGLDPYYSYILTNVLTLREIQENMFAEE